MLACLCILYCDIYRFEKSGTYWGQHGIIHSQHCIDSLVYFVQEPIRCRRPPRSTALFRLPWRPHPRPWQQLSRLRS